MHFYLHICKKSSTFAAAKVLNEYGYIYYSAPF